jgi:DNA-binding GntR family transcriptional regulator
MIKKPNKRNLVYQQIRSAILSGELKSGEILSIDDICQRFNSGKTPTREALIVLSHEQFLQPLPRIGYMITKASIRDVHEIFFVRMILEVEAIGLSVERMTPEDIHELEKNVQDEMKLSKNMSNYIVNKDAYKVNRDFHCNIARASNNLYLASLIQQLLDQVERILVLDPYLADPLQHQAVLTAIKKRNKVEAQEAMKIHLEETRGRILTRI